MSSRNTPLSSSRSASKTSSRSTSATKNLLIDISIHRISIDSSAALGSLYDARSECVVGKLTLDKKIITKTPQQKDVECIVMKTDKFDREELFRKIGIHEEPWLNLVLKIVSAEGIASIINYSFSKSSNIRFLYYYYSSEEQSISQVKNTVIANISKDYPDIAATHVISAIKLGIQALVVLQLPSNDEMNLDPLLEDIAQRVRKNKFQISSNEKPLLNRMIVTKVFSNIPTLNNMSTVAEISQKLNELKPHVFRHLPLEFTLRTIKWFYPSYPNEKARYTPLEPETVKLIKQYLEFFSSQINELKAWLSSQEAQTLKKHLEKQYHEFGQQITDAEKRYSNELQRIRDLITQIRSGSMQQQSIIERLSINLKESLQSNIDPIQEGLESSRKKIKQMNKLDEHKIPCWNMQQYSITQSDDLTTIFQKLCTKDKSMLIFCSNDYLREQNLSEWNEQCTKWMQELESNSSLTLIYADFTYTSYHLSKVTILLIKSKDDVEKPSESLSLLLQATTETIQASTEQSENVTTSLSPSIVRNLTDTKRISSEEKQLVKVYKQLQPLQSPTLPASKVVLESNSQSEEIEKPSCSSLPMEEILPELERVNKEKLLQNLPLSTPQVVPRKNNKSTDTQRKHDSSQFKGIPSSNEQINHEDEQYDTSLSSVASSPTVKPRSQHRDSSSPEPPLPSSLSKPPVAERSSTSKGLPESSGLSTSDAVQESHKSPDEIQKPASPPTLSNSLHTETVYSQDNQLAQANEQLNRLQSPALSVSNIEVTSDQQNEDNRDSANLSNSLRQVYTGNILLSMDDLNSLKDSDNRSRSSTARQRRRSGSAKKPVNTTESSNSSGMGNTALLNIPTGNEKELNTTATLPKILTPRAAPQIGKEPLKLPITNKTSSSEQQSTSADDHVSSPAIPSETAQRTEEKFVDTDQKPNQPISQEPLSNNDPLLLPQESNPPKSSSEAISPPTMEYINILLLGESGVGKSTFINALVNYLAFKTFEQARSSQPLVAMPVSFLMTIGDDFQEKIVRFGDIDPNEDHDHPGQSVTQHCRSYVFRIGTETKLRIIDTPGMGDTRGLDQDDRNMEHILSFINNLSHLNAICILLKPNESRLNVVLRSYFTRFLNFLGENAGNNIVFCFTNTRATFFAPGNTGPLLRKMINSLPMKGILFEKRNTFCFDSEAFRYLVALQNDIQFDTYQEKEYQQSWTASSTVSNQLIQFICQELKPYSQNEWQSIEHAQFKINQLIRPMLETVRNILRNTILLKEKSSELIIKLCSVALSQPSALCYKCPRTSQLLSDFWIVPDNLHTVLLNTCNECDCDTRKHIDVDYKLEYELIQHEGTESFRKMKSNLEHIRMIILECSQFYSYVVDSLKQNDPLLSALKRIIAEEKRISVEKGAKCLNSTLYNLFTGLTEEYKERRSSSISIHLPVDLPSIYELIEHISIIDEIKEQMRAIKQTQKTYLKEHEKQVS